MSNADPWAKSWFPVESLLGAAPTRRKVISALETCGRNESIPLTEKPREAHPALNRRSRRWLDQDAPGREHSSECQPERKLAPERKEAIAGMNVALSNLGNMELDGIIDFMRFSGVKKYNVRVTA